MEREGEDRTKNKASEGDSSGDHLETYGTEKVTAGIHKKKM